MLHDGRAGLRDRKPPGFAQAHRIFSTRSMLRSGVCHLARLGERRARKAGHLAETT
jgi:hypothetical protein